MAEQVAINDDVKYLENWAVFAEKAGMIPQGTTNYQAMAIVQTGKEMGLQPLQSLRSMNFIKGRLAMSVQLQLALARNTKNVTLEGMEEGEGFCSVVLRRGEESITCKYSVEDARRAGLIKIDGMWVKYQRQMLRWRAIGDALRIICPDVVMGLLSPEEAESIDTFNPHNISGKPATRAPVPIESVQVKTNIISMAKSTVTSKGGVKSEVYRLTDRDGGTYTTMEEGFVTLCKSANEAGLEVVITHKTDACKTVETIDLVDSAEKEAANATRQPTA